VDIGLAFFSGDGDKPRPLDLFVQAAIWADKRGLSALWTPERHFHPFGGAFPDPAVASAAVAGRTSQISLRSGSVVSPIHDIVEIVERWAMVDQLSNGRIGLTFAPGWRAQDFALNPTAFADRYSIMFAQIAEAQRLWAGEPVVRVDGSGAERQIRIFPRPVQTELPIWIACSSVANMEAAGRIGAGVLTHLVNQSEAQLAAGIRSYRASLPAGRAGHVALMVHTFVDESQDRARSIAREPLRRYLEQFSQLSKFSKSKPLGNQSGNQQMLLDIAAERYLRDKGLIGSPQTCADFLERLAAIGIEEVACLIDFGIDETEVLNGLSHIGRLAADGQLRNKKEKILER
jgi:natural product biosynthesis luciferase-like monooxygenase protein